jgi:DNA replication protein DnaC
MFYTATSIPRYSFIHWLSPFSVPFDANATKHLFRLVSVRHRKRSILLAANTGFNNWKSFFTSEAQAVATVDRLIDQATVLRFIGKSFRKRKLILG